LPVRAEVRVRNDLVSVHGAGVIVDVLQIEQVACGPVPCPSGPRPVMLWVAGNDPKTNVTRPVLGAMLSNVQRPPNSGVTPSFDCMNSAPPGYTTVTTTCLISGTVPGVYEADVSARGYQTKHVRVEVPAHTIQPYECCGVPFVSQPMWVD